MTDLSSYEPVTIPTWAQGRSGRGQGGYTAAQFQASIGEPVSIALRAAIPLEETMDVVRSESGWVLVAGTGTVMEATPSAVTYATTPAVSVRDAAAARAEFEADPATSHENHAAPHCRSCGLGVESMRVWPGPLADGTPRVASDWTPPAWTDDGRGNVQECFVWMALDCTCGFFLSGLGASKRDAVTVQYSVEVYAPIRVGETYVTVGFDGHWVGGWDGRKRGAASCVFDADGSMVAAADSFWVALD